MKSEIQTMVHQRLSQIAELMRDVGQDLRNIQKKHLKTLGVSNKPGSYRDIVTEADLESERRIRIFLEEKFPGDQFLAEEGGQKEKEENLSGFRWIVDPIDGTINFAHGIPLFAISAGLEYEGEIVSGVVVVPGLDETFHAVQGQGAYLNEDRIGVTSCEALRDAIVVTGFPYNREPVLDELTSTVSSILQHATGLRRTGTAALDLCWLSAGRFDAYYEAGLNPWDTAAGVLIAREGGALVTDLEGESYNPFHSKSIAASNGKFHGDFLSRLENLRNAVRLHGKL